MRIETHAPALLCRKGRCDFENDESRDRELRRPGAKESAIEPPQDRRDEAKQDRFELSRERCAVEDSGHAARPPQDREGDACEDELAHQRRVIAKRVDAPRTYMTPSDSAGVAMIVSP